MSEKTKPPSVVYALIAPPSRERNRINTFKTAMTRFLSLEAATRVFSFPAGNPREWWYEDNNPSAPPARAFQCGSNVSSRIPQLLSVPSSVNLLSPGVEEDKEAAHLTPSDAPDWMKRTRRCSPRGCDSVCFSRSGWCWCCTELRWGPGRPSMHRMSSLLPLSVGVRATRYGNNDCVELGVTRQDADI